MIKLSIYGFWPNFNYEDNFFKSLFEDIYGNDFVYTTNPHESNICLIGEKSIFFKIPCHCHSNAQ